MATTTARDSPRRLVVGEVLLCAVVAIWLVPLLCAVVDSWRSTRAHGPA